MDKYDIAYAFTQKWEGGLSDDPADRGGITNYGVCIEFLKDCARIDSVHCQHLGISLPLTRETIKALKKDQAKELFRWRFWDTPGFERYDTPLAITLFDCAVNHGVKRSILLAQKAFNNIGDPALWLIVDGIQGPKTKTALQSVNAAALSTAIISERRDFYRAIVKSNYSQRVFLRGWLNRADDLEKYVDTMGK